MRQKGGKPEISIVKNIMAMILSCFGFTIPYIMPWGLPLAATIQWWDRRFEWWYLAGQTVFITCGFFCAASIREIFLEGPDKRVDFSQDFRGIIPRKTREKIVRFRQEKFDLFLISESTGWKVEETVLQPLLKTQIHC